MTDLEKVLAECERLKIENEDLRAQVTTERTGLEILLQGNARLKARIAVLEQAVSDALAEARGNWDQMQRHPASQYAGDVAYYESVLHPGEALEVSESQAREMLGEDEP